VIGERLPVQRMLPAVAACADRLAEDAWEAAVRAIMTTDTVPKAVSRTVGIDGSTVTITGIAKGSGMIKPDMATMLAYVCCDAQVSRPCLEQLVRDVADESFNRITVDADTSTNDAFVVVATGRSPVFVETPDSGAYAALRSGLESVAATLAQWIVRDGEGATKFVTVDVRGGVDRRECLDVAYTVAESPLVKTAVFAGDPNWGRFCMAIGRAGVEDLDQARVDVWLEGVRVVHGGQKDADYTEEAGASVMARDELTIRIDLGRGSASARVWTSDLSYEYVRINAEYRS
jgi:glutamate N-acetyltransferase/amino-acid N-acetyltransferase